MTMIHKGRSSDAFGICPDWKASHYPDTHSLRRTARAQFGNQVSAMNFDSAHTDSQMTGYRIIGLPPGNAVENLHFTWSQRIH